MKILFYINILSDGGAERVIANLANYFSGIGDNIVLVNSFKTENEYWVSDKIKRYYLEPNNGLYKNIFIRNFKRVFELRRIVKLEKPNVVISFMKEPNVRSILATLGLKNVKNIISVRVDPKIEYNGICGYLISKFVLPLAEGCVFQTQEAKSWFVKSLQNKSDIIMNPVKEDFYSIIRKPVDGKIVTLGRLAKQKNHSVLIKAFNRIKDIFPNSILEIYGIGDEYQLLSSLIDNLKIKDRVFLRGRTNKPEKILKEADIFVLSSDFEGMPNSLMEAMATGIPCISTDCPCGGPNTLIKNNENGILVEVNNEVQLSEAIADLLGNSNKRISLGVNAKNTLLRFKPNTIFEKWNKYVRKVVES